MSVRVRVANYLEMLSRSRVLQIVCIGGILSIAACSNGARPDPVGEYSTELDVSADKQPVVSRALQAGTYLIEMREQEIDVRLVVDAGELHVELEDKTPRHGVLYQVVSLAAPGKLRVQLRSADHRTKQGRAQLRIARWKRKLDAPSSALESGFTAFGAAGQQTALATPEAWARAADLLHEAVSQFEIARDDAARADAAYSLANVQYGARDEWTATVRATEIAAEAFAASGNAIGVHNAATLRAAAELDLAAAMNSGTQQAEQRAMYEAADRRLAEATAFFTANGLPVRAQYATNMRGVRAVNMGDYQAADLYLSQAVAMARANRDVGEEAKALANLATTHNLRGYMAQAAEEYAALLPIVDRDAQPYLYAALLGNYGFCLIALGDFDQALELHLEALAIYTKIGDRDERATELAALGGLYFRMGDTGRALETLRSAITAQEQVSDTRGLASTLRVAANASAALGQHADALEYLHRSAQMDANTHSVARTSVLIAGELRALGDLSGAEKELVKPLAYANPLVKANALEERARLRVAQRKPAAAIADFRAADQQYSQLGLEFNRIDTNAALSQLLLAADDLAGAGAAADEAVSIATRIRTKSANPEWRARFLSARYGPFEARIAVDLADKTAGPQQSAWRGFRTAERVRARSLSDELAFDARGGVRTDPQDAALRARLTSQQLRLEARIQRQDPDTAGTFELRRAIEETRAQLDQNRLRGGGIASGASALPDSLSAIQPKLPADTAVLAYFVGDAVSHAWLLTSHEMRHGVLAGRVPLQRAVDAAIDAQRRTNGDGRAERELSVMLLGNLLAGLGEKRMLVITDGPLDGVPFAALPLAGSDNQLLVDRFVLGYAPSLALAMGAAPRTRDRATRVAVVSDPVYAADDLRLAARGDGGNFRGPPKPSPNNFTRLPYSALEASAVTKAFGATDTIRLSGFDASVPEVLKLAADNLAVLHFATHALARKDFPEQSALYLSEYSRDGSLLSDNRLTASEIAQSGLHAEVVVLSGCATGDGDELRGEGVLGLAYGFLANGSRSVVAALWPIEDASTARFMKEFYGSYRESRRASEALRNAQLRMRGNVAPAVWASFVVRADEFP
jgi:CHAT domain-containing protein/tetratricopeptide (TPR) repeat protein